MSAPAKIQCVVCAIESGRLTGDDVAFWPAALGRAPDDDDADERVLVCVPWGLHSVFSQRRLCADCGNPVAVSSSALWLLGESMQGPS